MTDHEHRKANAAMALESISNQPKPQDKSRYTLMLTVDVPTHIADEVLIYVQEAIRMHGEANLVGSPFNDIESKDVAVWMLHQNGKVLFNQ